MTNLVLYTLAIFGLYLSSVYGVDNPFAATKTNLNITNWWIARIVILMLLGGLVLRGYILHTKGNLNRYNALKLIIAGWFVMIVMTFVIQFVMIFQAS